MGITDWSVPIIVSTPIREKLAGDAHFSDIFFITEYRRVKKIYHDTGNPRLSYLCGKGVADLGEELQIRGSAGLGILHTALAEMLIASGASLSDLNAAESHLISGRNQLEQSPHTEIVAHAFGQWYMMLAVTYKARGQLSDYEDVLRRGVDDRWLRDQGTTGDRIPVIRQQVMMQQDLDSHVALILGAHQYKTERPLEYYRTLKRAMEFFTNSGLTASTERLKPEFVAAFSRIAKKVPLINHISFAKNLAQMAALEGDYAEARAAANAALVRARSASLSGQVRQLRGLLDAIEQRDVRGALQTFRV